MASDPVTVTLRDTAAAQVQRQIESGDYGSASEVVEDGLRALEREQAAYAEYVRVKVAGALADPRPPIPLKEAMAQIRAAPRKPLT